MRDDAVLGRALPLDRGLGPAAVLYASFIVLQRKILTKMYLNDK